MFYAAHKFEAGNEYRAEYQRLSNGKDLPFPISIYKNPTTDEMRKFVAWSARGWVAKTGDLYVEAYEPEIVEEYNLETNGGVPLSAVDHYTLREVAHGAGKDLPDSVSVVRKGNSDIFDYGESTWDDFEDTGIDETRLTNNFHKKNPALKLSGAVSRYESVSVIRKIDYLSEQGYSEHFIVDALMAQGHSPSSILEALINEEDGTVCSGDFGNALPADSRHSWKKDGEELNQQARDSLNKMGVPELKH